MMKRSRLGGILLIGFVSTLFAACLETSGTYQVPTDGSSSSGDTSSSSSSTSSGGSGGAGGGVGGVGGVGGAGGGTAGNAGAGGMPVPACGNGVVETGEVCDDGNLSDADGCSAICVTEPGENCPGNFVSLGETPVVLTGDLSKQVNDFDSSCGPASMEDVVYAVTPTISGTMTAALVLNGQKTISIRNECGGKHPLKVEEILCATEPTADHKVEMWVHAGVTYYVIAEGGNEPFTLTLSITRCGNGTPEGLEQCDDTNDDTCIGCVRCNGGNEFKDPLTNHCYRYVTAPPETWDKAREECVKWGGDLAAIRDKPEFEFLDKHMNPMLTGDIWVGGRAIDELCSYKWVTGEPWYIEWVTNQPNSTTDQCVEYFFASGERRLSDLGCTNLKAYLCERTPAGYCGDNIVQPGEECDGAALGGTCTADCKITFGCNGTGEFTDPATGHCYKVDTTDVNFFQAKWNCDAWGGYLAVVDSAAENALVDSNIAEWSWIGGWEGNQNNGTVIWEHAPVDCGYKNWRSGDPNSIGEACLAMDEGTGQWIDETCTNLRGYVCEKDP